MKKASRLKGYEENHKKICKAFSKRLKRLKANRCMTLQEIADILGVSRQSVVYYSMGERVPSVPILGNTA